MQKNLTRAIAMSLGVLTAAPMATLNAAYAAPFDGSTREAGVTVPWSLIPTGIRGFSFFEKN